MNMTTVPHALSMAENISVGVRPAISMTRPPMILPSVPPRPSVHEPISAWPMALSCGSFQCE